MKDPLCSKLPKVLWCKIFFFILSFLLKYHCVIQILGVHNFKIMSVSSIFHLSLEVKFYPSPDKCLLRWFSPSSFLFFSFWYPVIWAYTFALQFQWEWVIWLMVLVCCYYQTVLLTNHWDTAGLPGCVQQPYFQTVHIGLIPCVKAKDHPSNSFSVTSSPGVCSVLFNLIHAPLFTILSQILGHS